MVGRRGDAIRVFHLTALSPLVPEGLQAGDRVEIAWSAGNVLREISLR